MMARLRIYDPRERALVTAADVLLRPLGAMRRLRRDAPIRPARVLCVRLERIGDLLMTLPALAELRAALPSASIDLVVGSWNREIAQAIPGMSHVSTLDAAWLTRNAPGAPSSGGLGPLALARHAAQWRRQPYDLAINFEPDIRTNLAIAAAGARRTAGFASAGGGALLDVALDHDPSMHTADNAVRLVRVTLGLDEGPLPAALLQIPEASAHDAARLLRPLDGTRLAGIHVSGGRAIKQWPETRFLEVARHLVERRGASIVLTGTPSEQAQLRIVRDALPRERVVDLSGASLLTIAAVLQRLTLVVTGDTGPMHLAHAVGTPVVAVFGPSDPVRYAPRGVRDHVVRVDLPCSPCNRIRRPPARCVGHTPDCLVRVETTAVLSAVDEVLAAAGGNP